jgi:hypothetical protein
LMRAADGAALLRRDIGVVVPRQDDSQKCETPAVAGVSAFKLVERAYLPPCFAGSSAAGLAGAPVATR